MKLVAILLISCLICSSSGFSYSKLIEYGIAETFGINDQLKAMLESSKIHFPCGIPDLGIPVLAPLHIDELSHSIKSLTQLSSLEFRIADTDVHGLDTFEVDHINLNVLRMIMDLNITIPELKVQGKHDTTAWVLDRVPIKLVGTGDYTMVLKNLKIGMSMKMNAIQGKLNLNDMSLGMSIDEVDSNVRGILGPITTWTFNKILEAVVPKIINEQQELINEMAKEIALPIANSILNEMTLLDLLNMIAQAAQNPRPPAC